MAVWHSVNIQIQGQYQLLKMLRDEFVAVVARWKCAVLDVLAELRTHSRNGNDIIVQQLRRVETIQSVHRAAKVAPRESGHVKLIQFVAVANDTKRILEMPLLVPAGRVLAECMPTGCCEEWCSSSRLRAAATRTSVRATARRARWRRCHAGSGSAEAVAPKQHRPPPACGKTGRSPPPVAQR